MTSDGDTRAKKANTYSKEKNISRLDYNPIVEKSLCLLRLNELVKASEVGSKTMLTKGVMTRFAAPW